MGIAVHTPARPSLLLPTVRTNVLRVAAAQQDSLWMKVETVFLSHPVLATGEILSSHLALLTTALRLMKFALARMPSGTAMLQLSLKNLNGQPSCLLCVQDTKFLTLAPTIIS